MTAGLRPSPRHPGLRRGAAALAAVSAACAAAVPTAGAAAPPPTAQPLVMLLHDRIARAAPGVEARHIGRVAARRPLTGVHTQLPVLGRATASDGTSWVQVRLPGRPNGHAGWIPATRTRSTHTPWSIRVDLSERRVKVAFAGRTVRTFRAVVGKPSTPTPRGSFFVEEALALAGGQAGEPFALASSARSAVFQEFDGGPGQIALHGTGGLPGALGTAVSHGCVRLGTRAVTWMARRIGAGTPLTIVG